MPSPQISVRRFAHALGLAGSLVLAACGGGGDSPGIATPSSNSGTATAAAADTYAQGPISGFGSIVVGGVRYDDSSATITDEDGAGHDRSALKLGMTVEVDAGVVSRSAIGTSNADASAKASRIRFGSDVLGPVNSVNATASTLVVLGQTVLVTPATVFEDTLAGGLAALSAGRVIEVHGIRDTTTGQTVATRIEAKDTATAYRLRGTVSALDTAAKTFKIGSETINYAAVTPQPSTLANDQLVRVLLNPSPSAGAWVASALRSGTRLPTSATVREAHVEGLVTAFASTSAFTVNGLQIDASSASFPDGTTGIVLGARVEVEGSVSNGKLVATKVEIEDRRESGKRKAELHGDITSIDTTAQTFVLRGVTVWYGGTVSYTNGTAATLAVGSTVRVRGVVASDRNRIEARDISFKTSSSSGTTTG